MIRIPVYEGRFKVGIPYYAKTELMSEKAEDLREDGIRLAKYLFQNSPSCFYDSLLDQMLAQRKDPKNAVSASERKIKKTSKKSVCKV